MSTAWHAHQPIYRQIRDRIVTRVLDGALGDGDALPSVREVAAENAVNPLTVLKAYQLLVDEGLVESRRGLGMFIIDGACQALVQQLRTQFLETEWPSILVQIEQLGLDWHELVSRAEKTNKRKSK